MAKPDTGLGARRRPGGWRWARVALASSAALGLGACGARFQPCRLHACSLEERRPSDAFLAARGARSASMARAEARLGPAGGVAAAVSHGAVDCFEAGLRRTEPGRRDDLAYCEGSAVVFDGQRLVVASDKPIPGRSGSLFELPFRPGDGGDGGDGIARGGAQQAGGGRAGARASRYLEGPAVAAARKFEDATLTPDGARVFMTTGFDRVHADDPDWDGYNVLLSYPVDDPGEVRVVGADFAPAATSVALRAGLRAALASERFPEGPPYFKVEGLAAAPGRRLLFGIREMGASYRDFAYAVTVIEAHWERRADGALRIRPDSFRRVYQLDDLVVSGQRVGLSSLEYDPRRRQFWLLTSYEGPQAPLPSGAERGELGGFLFLLEPEDLRLGRPPRPVIGPGGGLVHFLNKPEGLTVVGPDRVLVLFDDDRVLSCGHPGHWHRRHPHQTPLELIEIAPIPAVARGAGPASGTGASGSTSPR